MNERAVMPSNPERTMSETIDRLLHDAEHADSGAQFAAMMARSDPSNPEHSQAARELTEKRDRLIREAVAADPNRADSSWEETTLDRRTIERAGTLSTVPATPGET